jgi:ABC-type anion transport system duplicated permease subunit
MLTAFLFLVVLDAIILSASPDLTRIVIAILVTLAVSLFVAVIWHRNSRLEKKSGTSTERSL